MKQFPLGLPENSVRALLALGCLGILAGLLFSHRLDEAKEFGITFGIIVGFYFGMRSIGSQPPEGNGR